MDGGIVLQLFFVVALFGSIIYLRTERGQETFHRLVFRSKHQEGQQLLKETISLKTPAPMADIVRELSTHVTVASELPLFSRGAVHQVSCDENGVVYMCGSKVNPQMFVAAVVFGETENKAKVNALYKIIRWNTLGGAVVAQDQMRKLRQEVQAAFTAVAYKQSK